ncbi:MAG: ribonuclease R [Steroidobacteraceae bacterium]
MAKRSKDKIQPEKSYQHPIPGRSELLALLTEAGRPVKTEELMQMLGLKGQRMRGLLVDQLYRMARAGQVLENRGGEFCLTEKLELIAGTVMGHKDGFGFVRRDDGEDDLYLSAREMRSVIDGDRVAVKVIGQDRRGRGEARVVEVLERGLREIAGQFIRERGIGIVIPDNPRIAHRLLIPKEEAGRARPSQMVVAQILDYPTDLEQPTGRIVRVIGEPGQKGIATDLAIHAHGIPDTWPNKARAEARAFGKSVDASAASRRVDLRDTLLVTIDGADARDFDDAVYCEPVGKGWRLLVAIADVAHYVAVGSGIDKEATRRGTSVYFPDRVVPMLPEVLSNGLCSLNPRVDRLCMVCDMRIDAAGKVTRSEFVEGVMRSHARLTYSQVYAFLSGEKGASVPRDVQQPLRNLHALYGAMAKARARRGAIELDIPQTRIALDEEGAVREIAAVERNDAHRLIEECMIAANVQAAKFLRHHRITGLYRVHAKPDPDRFDELRQYLLGLGLKVPHPDHVEPRHFNRLLEQVAGRPDAPAISMAMLRSMMHAEYTPKNIGHFGLALEAYAHFTSPIRRYPDLLVHRAVKHILKKGKNGKAGTYHYDNASMERLGDICSAHERRAEEATREVEAWLKCQYMEDKVGKRYEGVITGVTNFGAFVQIPSMQIDGLVHVSSLANDYYHFDAGSQSLVGERGGRRYRLGDRLKIVVSRVDMNTRRIDFTLDEEDAGRDARPARRQRGGRRR